jgi:hypothetical protein
MTMQAFQGDPELKAHLVDPLRPQWAANELIPASILNWDTENKAYSLCAAMIKGNDKDEFERQTGIPLEMAMLCEALIASNIEVAGDPTNPKGFRMDGSKEIMSFGMEWLDAVRPGADLSGVVPRFMAQWLTTLLAADFVLADHIEPDVRAAATCILGLWNRELAGEAIASKEWNPVRKTAVEAFDKLEDPWCMSIANVVETLAWPLRSVAPEFVINFQRLAVSWLGYLQRPFLSDEDRETEELELAGWLRIAKASRNSELDEAATTALMDEVPEQKKALFAKMDPVYQERTRAAKRRARVATDPVVRRQMDLMLTLIKAA